MDSLILQTAIGLVFVFAISAGLVSVIIEAISRYVGLRAEYLLRGSNSTVQAAERAAAAAATASTAAASKSQETGLAAATGAASATRGGAKGQGAAKASTQADTTPAEAETAAANALKASDAAAAALKAAQSAAALATTRFCRSLISTHDRSRQRCPCVSTATSSPAREVCPARRSVSGPGGGGARPPRPAQPMADGTA